MIFNLCFHLLSVHTDVYSSKSLSSFLNDLDEFYAGDRILLYLPLFFLSLFLYSLKKAITGASAILAIFLLDMFTIQINKSKKNDNRKQKYTNYLRERADPNYLSINVFVYFFVLVK